jgi:hypothetical protein
MVKKAFLKTFEALIAIVLTLIFVMLLVPKESISEPRGNKIEIMNELEKYPDFVSGTIENTGCFNRTSGNVLSNLTDKYLSSRYSYYMCIDAAAENLPNKRIYVDSIFITGNITNYQHKTARLYYWIS